MILDPELSPTFTNQMLLNFTYFFKLYINAPEFLPFFLTPPILCFPLHVFIVNGAVLNNISTSMCCILSIFPLLLLLSLSPVFPR